MEAALVRLVWQRAADCCEYCLIAQELDELPFEIDHIIAKKHHGRTVAGNLALTCFFCNSYKGPNIAGHDPKTGKLTPLFNPRRHKWQKHFRWDGPVLIGRTAIGRTTVTVLNINEDEAVATRELLMDAGLY